MAEPHYKLTYFDLRALGEPIRWQFILAGVPFEDNRIPRPLWDEQFKPKTGWGRVPVLNVDGKELTQAGAIGRFLAKRYNQLADTDWQNARCDELVDALQDLRILWRFWLRAPNGEEKAIHEKILLENHFPLYLSKMNDLVEQNGEGSGFSVGNKLTWADLFLANFLEIWTDNHGVQILDAFPALRKQKETVFNIPKIKEWVAKRPKTVV
jgi:glutathione S-transferase